MLEVSTSNFGGIDGAICGTKRGLSSPFFMMRNNAVRDRQFMAGFPEEDDHFSRHNFNQVDDRTALLNCDTEGDVQFVKKEKLIAFPPWLSSVNSIKSELTAIDAQVSSISSMQSRLISRPNFDDSVNENTIAIDTAVQGASDMLGRCKMLLQKIQNAPPDHGRQVRLLRSAVIQGLGLLIQKRASDLKIAEYKYIERMKMRKTWSNQFLAGFNEEADAVAEAESDALFVQQLKQLEMNTKHDYAILKSRDQDITKLVNSIITLNSIFKDVAGMVSEQGEMVNRIDQHVESIQLKVEEGVKQLHKARKSQKKNWKMKLILVLAGIVIILLLIILVQVS